MNLALSTEKDRVLKDKYSQTLLSTGPFIRYFLPTSNVRPFFELNSAFGTINSKFEYGVNTNWEDFEYMSNVRAVGGGIGLASPLGERVMFDVLAGYNSLTIKVKEDNVDNERTVIGMLGLKLGFSILLGTN